MALRIIQSFIVLLIIVTIFSSCELSDYDSYLSTDINEESYIQNQRCNNTNQRKQTLKTVNKIFRFIEKEKSKKVLKYFSYDIELIVRGDNEVIPFAGTYNGKQEANICLQAFFNVVNITDLIVRYSLIDDQNINSHIRLIGSVPETNKTFDLDFLFAWELNERNKISSLSLYYCTYSFELLFHEAGESHISDFQSSIDYFDPEMTGAKEIIDELLGYFFIGDLVSLVNMTSEDIVWILKGNNIVVPIAGVFYGHTGLWEFFSNLPLTSSLQYFTMNKTVIEGNRVDLFGYEEGISVQTGEFFTSHIVYTFVLNNSGKIIEYKCYNDSYNVSEACTPD